MNRDKRGLFSSLVWAVVLLLAMAPVVQADKSKSSVSKELTSGDGTRTPAADLDISGTVSYSISNGTVRLTADRVSNNSTVYTTGTLYLQLIASPDNSASGTAYTLGEARLGELQPNHYFYDIDQTVTFTRPPDGTYYLFMILVEYPDLTTIKDSVMFSNTVTWGNPLYGTINFGSVPTTCPLTTSSSLYNTTVNSAIPANGSHRWRIVVNEESTIALSSAYTADRLDTVATLTNEATGAQIASDDDSGSDRNFYILRNNLPAGNYILEITGYNGAGGTYVMQYAHCPTAPSLPEIVLSIEEPSQLANGIGNVRGWAVALDGIDRVEWDLNGVPKGEIPYGGNRGDIANNYPQYANSLYSGFSMARNWAQLSPGTHTITVRAYDNSGRSTSRTVSFNTTRFHIPYLANPAALSIGSNIQKTGDRSFVIRDTYYDGRYYDVHFTWSTSAQKFEISNVVQR